MFFVYFLPFTEVEGLDGFSIGGHSLMHRFFFERDVSNSLMSSGRLSYFEVFFALADGVMASASTPGVGQNFCKSFFLDLVYEPQSSLVD